MWGRVKPFWVWLVYTVKSWEEHQSGQDIEEEGGTVILSMRCETLPSGGGLFSNQQLRMFLNQSSERSSCLPKAAELANSRAETRTGSLGTKSMVDTQVKTEQQTFLGKGVGAGTA